MTQDYDPIRTVKEHWGDEAPDWVLALAQQCALKSQTTVGEELKRTGSYVSQVLRNKYPHDLGPVKDMVVRLYMQAEVDCPVLGKLLLQRCHEWRVKAQRFQGGNRQNVLMRKACMNCPKFVGGVHD